MVCWSERERERGCSSIQKKNTTTWSVLYRSHIATSSGKITLKANLIRLKSWLTLNTSFKLFKPSLFSGIFETMESHKSLQNKDKAAAITEQKIAFLSLLWTFRLKILNREAKFEYTREVNNIIKAAQWLMLVSQAVRNIQRPTWLDWHNSTLIEVLVVLPYQPL